MEKKEKLRKRLYKMVDECIEVGVGSEYILISKNDYMRELEKAREEGGNDYMREKVLDPIMNTKFYKDYLRKLNKRRKYAIKKAIELSKLKTKEEK